MSMVWDGMVWYVLSIDLAKPNSTNSSLINHFWLYMLPILTCLNIVKDRIKILYGPFIEKWNPKVYEKVSSCPPWVENFLSREGYSTKIGFKILKAGFSWFFRRKKTFSLANVLLHLLMQCTLDFLSTYYVQKF